MTHQPDRAALRALPDTQLLLRLRDLERLRSRAASEIEGAAAGLYNRKPNWLLTARERQAEIVAELTATQDEARERLDARKEARREERHARA